MKRHGRCHGISVSIPVVSNIGTTNTVIPIYVIKNEVDLIIRCGRIIVLKNAKIEIPICIIRNNRNFKECTPVHWITYTIFLMR